MIICGTGVLEVDARPIFFGNARHLHRSFSKILNNVIEVFRKSSATHSGFLENSQQVTRIFFENPQPATRGFPEKIDGIGRAAGFIEPEDGSFAPSRKPPRRISRRVNVLAPPCPVRGPEAGRAHNSFNYRGDHQEITLITSEIILLLYAT